MAKRHFEGGWVRDPSFRGFAYYPAGFYEEAQHPAPELVLTDQMIRQLVPVIELEGFIRPFIDRQSREDDLKIVHRLLDIVEKRRGRG